LIWLALKQLTGVKSEREDLEHRRILLQSKQNLLKRYGCGFSGGNMEEKSDGFSIEQQIREIDAQLNKIGGDDHIYETYLEVVVDLLGRPEDFLLGRQETLFVDRMGIKRDELSEDAAELPLRMLYNAEGRNLVVLPVILQAAELQELYP